MDSVNEKIASLARLALRVAELERLDDFYLSSAEIRVMAQNREAIQNLEKRMTP